MSSSAIASKPPRGKMVSTANESGKQAGTGGSNKSNETKAFRANSPDQSASNESQGATKSKPNAWSKPLPSVTPPPGMGPISSTKTTNSSNLGTSSSIDESMDGNHSINHQEDDATTIPALRERFLHLLLALVGQRVQLTFQNGTVVTGVFHTATPFPALPAEQRHKYVLKAVSIVEQPITATSTTSTVVDESITKTTTTTTCTSTTTTIEAGQTLVLDMNQVQQIHIKSLRIDTLAIQSSNQQGTGPQGNFQTDTEISGKSGSASKALVAAGSAWTTPPTSGNAPRLSGNNSTAINARAAALMGDAALASSSRSGTISPSGNTALQGSIGTWDQFQANEVLFNVKGTFDESIYTTQLDKTKMKEEQIRKAEQLAREIESAPSANIHVAEERGQAVQEDFDEEDRYSGVLRKTTSVSVPNRMTNSTPPSPITTTSVTTTATITSSSCNSSVATSSGMPHLPPVPPPTVPPPQPTMNYAAAAAKAKAGNKESIAGKSKVTETASTKVPAKTVPVEESASSAAATPATNIALAAASVPTTHMKPLQSVASTEKVTEPAVVASNEKAAEVTNAQDDGTQDKPTDAAVSTKGKTDVLAGKSIEPAATTAIVAKVANSKSSNAKQPQEQVTTKVDEKNDTQGVKNESRTETEFKPEARKDDEKIVTPLDEGVDSAVKAVESLTVEGADKSSIPQTTEGDKVKLVDVPDESESKNESKSDDASSKSKLNAKAKEFTMNINAKTFTPYGAGGTPFVPPHDSMFPQQPPHPSQFIDPATGMPMHMPAPHYMPGPMGMMHMMHPQYPMMRFPGQYPGMEQMPQPMHTQQQQPLPPQEPITLGEDAGSSSPLTPEDGPGEKVSELVTGPPEIESSAMAQEGEHAQAIPLPGQQPQQQQGLPPQQMPMPYGMPPGAAAPYYQPMGMQRGMYPPQPFVPHPVPVIRPVYAMAPPVIRGPYYPAGPGLQPGFYSFEPDDGGYRGGRSGGRGGRGRGRGMGRAPAAGRQSSAGRGRYQSGTQGSSNGLSSGTAEIDNSGKE